MSRKLLILSLGILAAMNIIALGVNMSVPSRATVAGMSYKQLVNDKDFTRAVKSVVEGCKVDVDLGTLKC